MAKSFYNSLRGFVSPVNNEEALCVAFDRDLLWERVWVKVEEIDRLQETSLQVWRRGEDVSSLKGRIDRLRRTVKRGWETIDRIEALLKEYNDLEERGEGWEY